MRNRFHSLCPYFAMFPEAFPDRWIRELTQPGDVILDPFCGRGTTPFQAALLGRSPIACDVNPVAYCITRAKLGAPTAPVLRRRLTQLEKAYCDGSGDAAKSCLPEFFRWAYHRDTLRQVLFLRQKLRWRESATDCMLAAMCLGALHGESQKSPLYLSNQMPRSISTKPKYSVKFWMTRNLEPPRRNAFDVLRRLVDFRYVTAPPKAVGTVLCADMRQLPRLLRASNSLPKCVVTSPPYLDVTNFEEDQWLRLWFLGGPANPTYGEVSTDDRHERPAQYWNFIGDMWRSLGLVMAPRGHVVVRLGSRSAAPIELANALTGSAAFAGRRVRLASPPEVSSIRERQTRSFRPGSRGCLSEVDCHFVFD